MQFIFNLVKVLLGKSCSLGYHMLSSVTTCSLRIMFIYNFIYFLFWFESKCLLLMVQIRGF